MTSAHPMNPRSLILGTLAMMMFTSLTCSLSIRAGHADTPIAVSAELVQPIAVGEPAPRFFVKTIDGAPFDFDPAALERPTIIITFRGGWCPYCNMHLSELRHVIPEIRQLGIDVLFLSGDRPDVLYAGLGRETQQDIDGLDYRILSDANANAATALGIAFTVDPDYVKRLLTAGKDIADSSITRHDVLPVPAVFAIGADGVVAFSHANPNYKVRIPAEELLEVATALASR